MAKRLIKKAHIHSVAAFKRIEALPDGASEEVMTEALELAYLAGYAEALKDTVDRHLVDETL